MGQAPSERMAALILDEEGFESIDPAHPLGGKDGGADAVIQKDGGGHRRCTNLDRTWILAHSLVKISALAVPRNRAAEVRWPVAVRYTVPTEHRVDEQPGQLRVAAEFEKGVAVPSADLVSRFMGFGSHGAGRRSSAAEVIRHRNRSGRPSCGPGWPCARRAGVGCPRR